MTKPIKNEPRKRLVQISEKNDKTEFGLVDELASLLGLKRATALKLYLRENLPGSLAKLKAKVNGVCNV